MTTTRRRAARLPETVDEATAAILRALDAEPSIPVRDLADVGDARLVQTALHNLLAQGIVAITNRHVTLDRTRCPTSPTNPQPAPPPPQPAADDTTAQQLRELAARVEELAAQAARTPDLAPPEPPADPPPITSNPAVQAIRQALTAHGPLDHASLLGTVPYALRGPGFSAALAALLACGAVVKRGGRYRLGPGLPAVAASPANTNTKGHQV